MSTAATPTVCSPDAAARKQQEKQTTTASSAATRVGWVIFAGVYPPAVWVAMTRAISSRGHPMSPTMTSPRYLDAAGLLKPTLGATNVIVRSATTAVAVASRGSPVSQSSPLGTSTASTGLSESAIAFTISPNGSRGGS